MKAVVLAGGLGTRLQPLTANIPKPMVPVANQPLMEYVIYLLRKHKIRDVTVLLYHQPNIIKNYFGDGSKFGVNLVYIEAKENYGTAGAVRFAAQGSKEPFLVISADLVTDFDLQAAARFHQEKKPLATLVLTRVANPLQYGIVITGKDGRVKHFLEKPSWSEVFSDTVNCGIYFLDPAVFEYIPPGRPVDFSQDVFPALLEEGRPLYGYVAKGTWKDIGNLVEYSKVNVEIMGGNSVGRNCKIDPSARLEQCVLWDNVTIGAGARLNQTIVARDSSIGDRTVCEEGVVIGEECNIGSDCEIKPYVKLWPKRVIESGAVVSRSMVWRERWARNIFGPYGVTGVCNVEITPEFAAMLGAAYGSLLGKGSRISTSRDSHKASRMIYRALLAGVLSAGVSISDLEMVPIPVNRYELKSLKSRGGFHIRKSPYDQQVIDIKFFDENGMDLASASEKKIERLFFGEDFKRTGVEDAGDLNFPFHRVAESYKEGVLGALDREAIGAGNFKVVIDYAYGSASQIFPAILGELGIEVIALGAHIDETKITKTRAMFEKAHSQLSQIVKSLGADLGIMLDTGAEKIFICDETGRIFQGDLELAIMAILFGRLHKKVELGVPVKASRVIDEVAKRYGLRVIRTKTSVRAMMENCYKGRMKFFGETAGGFIFPEFQCAFDAMFSSLKLLEMLAKSKVKLSEVAAEVPKINMASKEVSCAAEHKGKVLRSIVDSLGEEEVDLTDGVKIFHGNDWALVLPDPSRPVIHLYAEAETEKQAAKLIDKYIEKIDSLI
ncbi:MAG: mannose-1-phosphate guanyltransferase [Candidatus Saganbacteria bacterium]|nr:mannose-1-phosphate guanyltransferase [Candidatus Saganbacteria bacterium]